MTNLRRLLPLLTLVVLAAVVAAALVWRPGSAQAQETPEVGLLSRIVFVVGAGSGGRYGYSASDSYGTLVSGNFDRGLFDDDSDRRVAQIYEGSDGFWRLYYSGGADNQWLSDQDALDAINVTVTYEAGMDERSFVLGGFIEEVLSGNGLKLDPPIPSRDWNGKETEEVVIEFRRHRSEAPTPPMLPPAETASVGAVGTLAGLLDQTPGGPVVVQMLITVIVTGALLVGAVSSNRTPMAPLVCLGSLVFTPWIPAMIGYGSYILSSMVTLMVLGGAAGWKVLTRPVK